MIHIVAKILTTLAVFVGVCIFCVLGLDVFHYGQETKFEPDRNMVMASVGKWTDGIGKSDQEITETGMDDVDDAQKTVSFSVKNLMKQFEDMLGGFVSGVAVVFMSTIWFIREQGFIAAGEIAAFIERGVV